MNIKAAKTLTPVVIDICLMYECGVPWKSYFLKQYNTSLGATKKALEPFHKYGEAELELLSKTICSY